MWENGLFRKRYWWKHFINSWKKYEEFSGKNTCFNNNKNFTYFIAEIYDSNYILNDSSNKSTLDLTECENILKNIYNIPENQSLTIFKIDYFNEKSSISQTEYKIYNKDILLNLSYCDNITIKITKPINLNLLNVDISKFNETLNNPDIDIFDINSNFFNDICFTFSTSNKTDIILNDRKNDYYQNISLCEENCTYDSFNKETYKVTCICGIKNKIESKKITNNINKLFSNSNLKVLKCINLYFNYKNYIKNLGSLIFKICEIFLIILLILTFRSSYPSYLKTIKIFEKKINIKNDDSRDILNPPKKIINSSSINSFNINENKLKLNNIITYKEINYFGIINSKNKFIKKRDKKNINNINIYTNEIINNLDYNKSILIDHRNFFIIYYSFLEYSQLIIFTFFTKTDYNIREVKISLFIFSFIIFLTFNTLFFTDESMSHIYKKGGSFDFIYNLPKTIFSSICCGVTNFILKYLSLTQKDISLLNQLKNEKEKIDKINKIKKYLLFKLIIFYFLLFLFIELFQIYVGTFCTIYKNTQKHLFKNTFISFLLSMIYPFGICLFTTIFRKLSLYKRSKLFFLISKIFQLFWIIYISFFIFFIINLIIIFNLYF